MCWREVGLGSQKQNCAWLSPSILLSSWDVALLMRFPRVWSYHLSSVKAWILLFVFEMIRYTCIPRWLCGRTGNWERTRGFGCRTVRSRLSISFLPSFQLSASLRSRSCVRAARPSLVSVKQGACQVVYHVNEIHRIHWNEISLFAPYWWYDHEIQFVDLFSCVHRLWSRWAWMGLPIAPLCG